MPIAVSCFLRALKIYLELAKYLACFAWILNHNDIIVFWGGDFFLGNFNNNFCFCNALSDNQAIMGGKCRVHFL
jgi:hypothetical protein